MSVPHRISSNIAHKDKSDSITNLRLLAPSYQRRFSTIIHLTGKLGEILDLGCADGFYSKAIACSRNRVTGVDINTAFLDETSIDDNPRFIAADATNLPFNNNHFDTVICVDMLEHVAQDGLVIKEIHRILKPRGQLVISVPNKKYPATYDPINTLLTPFNRHLSIGIWGFGHRRLYSPEGLKTALENSGFEQAEITFLTHGFAAFFESYISTIFQWVAIREKTRCHQRNISTIGEYLYRLGCKITNKINVMDARICATSRTSVGFVITTIKNER